MLTYTNITRHNNIPFPGYQLWPEYSHSVLKYQNRPLKEVTDNMVFGNIVDAILCNEVTGELYSHPFYPHCIKHVETINSKFGYAIQHMDKQVCYKGAVSANGWTLPTKVRLDMQLGNSLLFENKITFAGGKNKKAPDHVKIKSMLDIISYMQYDNQVFHQMGMAKIDQGYIMIHSVPLDETFLFKRLETEQDKVLCKEWWAKQISLYGL